MTEHNGREYYAPAFKTNRYLYMIGHQKNDKNLPAVRFGQFVTGFPDFDPPRAILDRLAEVANEDFHQYSITWGAQNFREALAAKQSHFMGCSIDPDCEDCG